MNVIPLPKVIKVSTPSFMRDHQGYVSAHEGLARARLEVLKVSHGIKVHSTEIVNEGWGDGMKVLQAVIELKSGKLMKLQWMDSNQDFGKKYENHGGVGMLFASDLA